MPSSRRQTFENTLSGAQPPPLLPPLKGDPTPGPPLPATLEEFRDNEGKRARETRLRALWKALPAKTTRSRKPTASRHDASPEAQKMREIYDHELLSRMGRPNGDPKPVDWNEFLKYSNEKETELWRVFHHELDLVSTPPSIYTALCTRVP
jgi:solute carrier family 25 (mitochondrial phosphate transporter), member 23/24/25/41